jgi:hypothetical protein
VNNAGKSTLLRMLFELRTLFARVSEGQPLQPALNGNENGSNQITIAGVADEQEIFSNRNRRKITITVRVEGDEPDTLFPSALELSISRDRPTAFLARFDNGSSWLPETNFSVSLEPDVLSLGDIPVSPLGAYRDAGQLLANALYIPAVRNAVQVGATQPYYDLQIGQAFVGAWDRFKAGPDKQSRSGAGSPGLTRVG